MWHTLALCECVCNNCASTARGNFGPGCMRSLNDDVICNENYEKVSHMLRTLYPQKLVNIFWRCPWHWRHHEAPGWQGSSRTTGACTTQEYRYKWRDIVNKYTLFHLAHKPTYLPTPLATTLRLTLTIHYHPSTCVTLGNPLSNSLPTFSLLLQSIFSLLLPLFQNSSASSASQAAELRDAGPKIFEYSGPAVSWLTWQSTHHKEKKM